MKSKPEIGIQVQKNNRLCSSFILIIIISFTFVFFSGCMSIPGTPAGDAVPVQTPVSPGTEENLSIDNITPDIVDIPLTPEPTPTPIISTVSDWNPYEVVPYPESEHTRASILRNDTSTNRQILNTTYSGSVNLNGYSYGKELNITRAPFSITYTVHPNIENPLLVWAKLTVLDPWQNVTAEGGYNRHYSSDQTKTMTLYQEGKFYIIFEGEYASVDYTLKTGDPTPEPTSTPVPIEDYE
jgi:hypothetical protein